jgi:hypothetical protein
VAALNERVQSLIGRCRRDVPWFDPQGGGVRARILVLLESPGPKSIGGPGSGIISPDNDDTTAENFFLLRERAGISRKWLVHWNAAPWYLGQRRHPSASDILAGAQFLAEVIPSLVRLRVVFLGGDYADKCWTLFKRLSGSNPAQEIRTWHPSRLAIGTVANATQTERNTRRQREFLEALGDARFYVQSLRPRRPVPYDSAHPRDRRDR